MGMKEQTGAVELSTDSGADVPVREPYMPPQLVAVGNLNTLLAGSAVSGDDGDETPRNG